MICGLTSSLPCAQPLASGIANLLCKHDPMKVPYPALKRQTYVKEDAEERILTQSVEVCSDTETFKLLIDVTLNQHISTQSAL